MTRIAGDLDPPRNWEMLLGSMQSSESVKIVGRPFGLKLNNAFVKGEAAVILTSHRLILGATKSGLFAGPKVEGKVTIDLASVTDDIATYSRPYAAGDLMYGIEGRTPSGWFDAYFNTLDEQDTIFRMLQGALALRAWVD